MTITHLGHACVLYSTPADRVLIDPGTLSSFSDLRDLTAVLVTHEHADHVDVPGVLALLEANPSAWLVCDSRTAASVPSATVANPGDSLSLGDVTVSVLGGTHAPVYGDVPDCPNLAYLLDDGALLHPGDSFFVPEQKIDVLGLPTGAPWLKAGEAVDFLRAVAPRKSVPIHEAVLSSPALHYGLFENLAPQGTEVQVVERGVATQL